MLYVLGRWLIYPLLCLLVVPSLSLAQIAKNSPTLAGLYQAAWQRHPSYAAQAARQTQFAAQSELAQSVIAGVPTASVGYRSDGVANPITRSGLREWELGLSAPVALGARRRFASQTSLAQEKSYAADLHKVQWQLAGELREAYWAWQLAHIEHLLSDDEVRRAELLAGDSLRRSMAGETPRVDTLQAQSALGLARANLAESLQKEAQSLSALQRLVGAPSLAQVSESQLSAYQMEGQRTEQAVLHPALASLERQLQLSQSRLQTLLQVKGEAPTVGAGFSHETSNGSAAQTTARVTLSFALGTSARFAPKISEASADAIEAEIVLLRATEQLVLDRAVASAALVSADQKMQAAQARAAASTEAAQLFANAFSLGELEMPARLRYEAERAAAVLAKNRAVIEYAAALSKLNQIQGYLP